MRAVVYTCVTAGYDRLAPPVKVDQFLDYVCFTDGSVDVPGPWKEIRLPMAAYTPKDMNRRVKMYPSEFLPGYDSSVYIDGNIRLNGSPLRLISATLLRPESVFAFEHPFRICAFDEAIACSHYSHDWIWTIAHQMRGYSEQGFPARAGLFEANVLLRRHDSEMSTLMDEWWRQYRAGVKRDQLSLPFASWRTGIPIGSLGQSDARFDRAVFSLEEHARTKRSIGTTARKLINRAVGRLCTYKRLYMIPE